MEKLVKLLNEYVGQDSYWIDEFDNGAFIDWGDGDQCFIDEHIISKKFGFIKWLVDNDKIDQTVIDGNFGYFCMEGFGNVDSLLMVLAISNEPINDLISYLK